MRRGFSILELFIAIAIISILAAMTFVLFSSAQERARDTKRFEQVTQIQKALDLYYVSHTAFPVFSDGITITGEDAFSDALIAENVMPAVPPDPQHPIRTYVYTSNASGGTYTLSFCLESDSIPGYEPGCGHELKP